MQIPGLWEKIAGVKKELLKLGIPLSDVITKTGNENSEGRRCNVFADGMYSVQTLRKKIDELTLVDLQKMEWEKEVPNKVPRFIWRARMGRIPTVVELWKRRYT